MRAWVLRLHRWSTFVLGLLFVLISVTGSVLVFGDEIDQRLNPSFFAATRGDVGPDSALASVRSAARGRPVVWLWFPRPESPVYIGKLAGPTRIHVDPGTGRVLGTRGEPAINVLHQLHVNLFGGLRGARVVGWLGIALLAMMVTGIWLWWPGIRKLALGFRVRRRGGAALVNYDLHNVTGILTAPVLALIVLSGVAIIFIPASRTVLHALWLRTPDPIVRMEGTRIAVREGAAALPLADIVRRAQDTLPGYEMLSVLLPQRPDQGVQVRMSKSGVRHRDGLVRVLLHPSTGEIIGTLDLRTLAPPDAFRRRWLISLHAGEFGGIPMRALYLLVGLIPAGLMGTGLVVWWLRRRGRLAIAERRAARAA